MAFSALVYAHSSFGKQNPERIRRKWTREFHCLIAFPPCHLDKFQEFHKQYHEGTAARNHIFAITADENSSSLKLDDKSPNKLGWSIACTFRICLKQKCLFPSIGSFQILPSNGDSDWSTSRSKTLKRAKVRNTFVIKRKRSSLNIFK